MILALALVFAAGVGIGAASIGGVLVAPALTEAANVPLDRAIAAAMFAFMLTGALGAFNARGVRLPGLVPLNLAALVGAALGALLMGSISSTAIRVLIALVAIASGLHALRPDAATGSGRVPRSPTLVGLGLVVGCGSALSGTGGPVMLLPIFMMIGVPVRTGIAMALVVQLPVAAAATVVNAIEGRLDLWLSIGVAAAVGAGALLGMRISKRIPTRTLKRILALGLVVLGVWYGGVAIRG